MSRINSNIAAMIARVNLNQANDDLETRFQRLATGLRINRGADDPAGLIVSERLRTELEGIGQGIKNSERASNVIATTEGALTEVSELLNSIKALVIEAANTGAFSKEETQANQLQIDSAIDSITRISNTATFGGLKLLNGELGYVLSGLDSTQLPKVTVNSLVFGDRAQIPVDVDVIGSAQNANLFMRTDYSSYIGGTSVDNVLPESIQLEFQGPTGVQVLEFVSGQPTADIVNAINQYRSTTGLSASIATGSAIQISSIGYGTEEFVSIRKLGGGPNIDFGKVENNAPVDPGTDVDWTGGLGNVETVDIGVNAAVRDVGKDAVVLVNGVLATANGLDVSVRTRAFDVEVILDPAFAQTIGNNSSFNVTGGGSIFQLGPQVTTNQQTNIGIDSIAGTRLGGTLVTPTGATSPTLQFLESLKSGGDNSLASGRFDSASSILDTAIDEISTSRGRLGAFERNVIQTNISSLEAALENITASSSVIRDADFAFETSQLTRAQVLSQSGTSVLAQANASAQNVLQLLG